jgi:hypothetical protein
LGDLSWRSSLAAKPVGKRALAVTIDLAALVNSHLALIQRWTQQLNNEPRPRVS